MVFELTFWTRFGALPGFCAKSGGTGSTGASHSHLKVFNTQWQCSDVYCSATHNTYVRIDLSGKEGYLLHCQKCVGNRP